MNLFDLVTPMTVEEAKTDYQKRREHEKRVELGNPTTKPRQSTQTDYQKRRAEQRRQEELGELSVDTLKSYQDKRGAQVAAMKADNPNPAPGSEEWIQQAVPAQNIARAGQKILRKEKTQAVSEDSWHAGDNAWSSDRHEMVEGHLTVGDPIKVMAPNEFQGKTGEIAEFSPSGAFVIVNLYNHGEHSMHLSDVKYYVDDEDLDEANFGQAIKQLDQTGKELQQDPKYKSDVRRTQQVQQQRQQNRERQAKGYGDDADEYADVDEDKDNKRELYRKTQDAPTKQAIDKGYIANPTASNDTEALASLLSRELANLEKEKEINQNQEKQIQDINKKINKLSGTEPAAKEPAKQTVTKNVINPETGTPEKKSVQVPATSNVIPMPVARATAPKAAAPSMDTVQATAPTAKTATLPTAKTATLPTATPVALPTSAPIATPAAPKAVAPVEPTTQVSQPTVEPEELPFKGKGQGPSTAGIFGVGGSPKKQDIDDKEDQDDADTEFDPSQLGAMGQLIQGPWGQQPEEQPKKTGTYHESAQSTTSPAIGSMVSQLVPGAGQTHRYPPSVDPMQVQVQTNARAFGVGKLKERDARLTFGPANVVVPAEEVARIWEYVTTMYPNQSEQLDAWTKMFSNLNVFRTIRQQVAEFQQSLPLREGDVIPFTQDNLVNSAHKDAVQFLQAVRHQSNVENINLLRQNFASKYSQRFMISQGPNKDFYMLDKQTNQRHALPNPATLEESMSDIAIEFEDYKNLDPLAFFKAYNMTKKEWFNKNKTIVARAPQQDVPVNEHIVKVKGGYELKSKHGNKNLGKYPTRAGAEKRERQVQYFKHAGESVEEGSETFRNKIRDALWYAYQNDPMMPPESHEHSPEDMGEDEYEDFEENVDEILEFALANNITNANLAVAKYDSERSPHLAHLDPVHEGFQDFNKVEPYAVCLAGKPVKKFDYYEDARRFHDNWKKKLYREGNKAKADKITLMPLNLDEDVKTIKGAHGRLDVDTNTPGVTKVRQKDRLGAKTFTKDPYRVGGSRIGQKSPDTPRGSSLNSIGAYNRNPSGRIFPRLDHSDDINQLAHYSAESTNPAKQAAIAIAMKRAGKKPAQVNEEDQVKKVFKDKAGKPVGEIGIDPESSPGNGEWYVYHYATGYSVVGFDSAAEAKRELMYVHKHPEAVEGHPSTKEQGVAEMTDAEVAKIRNDAEEYATKQMTAPKKPVPQKSFMQQVGDKQIGMVKGAIKGFKDPESVKEMDKSQKGPAGWNLDDYDYGKGKWTQGKIVKAKDAVKDMHKELNRAFNTEPKAKKPVKESYWTKLQNERSTKLNSLVNELKESIEK